MKRDIWNTKDECYSTFYYYCRDKRIMRRVCCKAKLWLELLRALPTLLRRLEGSRYIVAKLYVAESASLYCRFKFMSLSYCCC